MDAKKNLLTADGRRFTQIRLIHRLRFEAVPEEGARRAQPTDVFSVNAWDLSPKQNLRKSASICG